MEASLNVVAPPRQEPGTTRVLRPLTAPEPGPGLLPRSRLTDRLMEATAPLALLMAPAGYGKTTLAAEWAGCDARPFAWITADELDNDPRRLRASISNALAGLERSFVLVLDDAHLIREPAALQALTTIVDTLAPGCTLALSGRGQPGLALGRLRAHRQITELRTLDLAMTRGEAETLLRLLGLDLGEQARAAVVERTEGWPAALYLAGLALGDQSDADAAALAFHGDDRFVADYLRDEFLSGATPEQLDFLSSTSILERLSGPLCDAVLERGDSAATLMELARADLLLPLDRHDKWYRHHGLFREMLRAELHRFEPRRETSLNKQAQKWHSAEGDTGQALVHAIAARDVDGAGDLLWHAGPAVVERGLTAFAETEIARSPAFSLVAAGSRMAAGDGNGLRRWTAAAARSLGRRSSDERTPSLAAGHAVMAAAIAEDGTTRMREDAARAAAQAPGDSPMGATARLLEGVACRLSGDRDRAVRALRDGARGAVVAAPLVQSLCLAELALLARDEGDWAQGEEHARRAVTQVERYRLGGYPISALVFSVSACIDARRGRVDRADGDLRTALQLLTLVEDFPDWYCAEVKIAAGLAAFRLSDHATAGRLLAEAARSVERMSAPGALRDVLDEASVQLTEALRSSGDGSLTTAELRVLQFLPSHLSFPEIAGELCVSQNTVKTHARAVYRKLDASSRTEAVGHAREAGCLR